MTAVSVVVVAVAAAWCAVGAGALAGLGLVSAGAACFGVAVWLGVEVLAARDARRGV